MAVLQLVDVFEEVFDFIDPNFFDYVWISGVMRILRHPLFVIALGLNGMLVILQSLLQSLVALHHLIIELIGSLHLLVVLCLLMHYPVLQRQPAIDRICLHLGSMTQLLVLDSHPLLLIMPLDLYGLNGMTLLKLSLDQSLVLLQLQAFVLQPQIQDEFMSVAIVVPGGGLTLSGLLDFGVGHGLLIDLLSEMDQKFVDVVDSAALFQDFVVFGHGSFSRDFLDFVAVAVGFDVVSVVDLFGGQIMHFEGLERVFPGFLLSEGLGMVPVSEYGFAPNRGLL